jgi:hypothetical protein
MRDDRPDGSGRDRVRSAILVSPNRRRTDEMIQTTPTGDPPVFEPPLDRADELRASADAVRFLDLPPRRAVMIDGEGPPGEAAFAPRMPGLYAAAYTLRFALNVAGSTVGSGRSRASGGPPRRRRTWTPSCRRTAAIGDGPC